MLSETNEMGARNLWARGGDIRLTALVNFSLSDTAKLQIHTRLGLQSCADRKTL